MPRDNLYAFGKLWATYGEEPVYPAFHGLMFARIGDRRLQPLFGYTGFGNFRNLISQPGKVGADGLVQAAAVDAARGRADRHAEPPFDAGLDTGQHAVPAALEVAAQRRDRLAHQQVAHATGLGGQTQPP